MNRVRPLPLLALIAALLAGGCGSGADAPETDVPASGDDHSSSPAAGDDAADVGEHRLTMEGVDRYFTATINVARVVQGMSPAEREAFEGMSDEEMPSLDDMARRIEQHPAVANAVRDAGLSPREYALTGLAILQAGMAQAVVAMQPAADPDSLARAMNVLPENIAFMRDNAEELGRRQEEMAAAMEALEPQE